MVTVQLELDDMEAAKHDDEVAKQATLERQEEHRSKVRRRYPECVVKNMLKTAMCGTLARYVVGLGWPRVRAGGVSTAMIRHVMKSLAHCRCHPHKGNAALSSANNE